MKKAFIAVAGTGGAGKSFLARELAVAYADKRGLSQTDNIRVLLIDANLDVSSQTCNFKLLPSRYDFTDLITEHKRLSLRRDDALEYYNWAFLQKYLSYDEARNLYILSNTKNRPTKGGVSHPDAITIYKALFNQFDIIVCDLSNTWDGENMAAFEMATDIIFVNTDTKTSHLKIMNCRRQLIGRGMKDKLENNSFLVCNMYRPDHTFMSPLATSAYLDLPLIGIIPYDMEVQYILNVNALVADSNETIAKAVYDIAGKLVHENMQYRKKK